MIWCGTTLVAVFNLLYLLIVFDVIRDPWFYIFTDVTGELSRFCMNNAQSNQVCYNKYLIFHNVCLKITLWSH